MEFENATRERFEKRIAAMKSLLDKRDLEAARKFAIGFEEVSDFEHWVLDRHLDILDLAAAPIESLKPIEGGEQAMLLLHAIYLLSLGQKLRTLFQERGNEPSDETELLRDYSLVAFALRTSLIPFWPFERTNLPLIDGYQHASESWW